MGSGSLADFESLYTADAVNRESATEPPDTRGTGPVAMFATAVWLRTAFSDLAWEIHDVAHDDDLVVVHATMSGRQTGPFVAYRPDGEVAAAFPPRGRRFAITQSHWFRMRDGRVAEHWANRDDLGMGQQLGWTPPTPLYLARMLLATHAARRTAPQDRGTRTMSMLPSGTGASEGPANDEPAKDGDHGWQLRTPTAQHAETVAGWSCSAAEAGRWVSNAVHPFPASAVTGWWQRPDVQPWLLVDPQDVPVGYGEIWDDADEDEVELARLIIDPHRRRQGVGRLLVDQLLTRARRSGRADCFLRVAPDNTAALALYRSAGFRDVDPAHADAWNQQQPVDYVWLHRHSAPIERRLDRKRTTSSSTRTHRITHHIERTTSCPPSPSTPPSSTQQSSRKKRRLRRTLLVALAAAAAFTAPTVEAAADAEIGGSPPLRDKQLLIASGKGKVTDECPSASTVPPAPAAGSFRAPTRARRSVRERFFAAIDDGNAASTRRCVPATFSGLLYETPDDAITQVGEGKVCPNGAGGHVFTGRVDIAGVSGRFQDVSSGRGHILSHHRQERLRHPHPHRPPPRRLAAARLRPLRHDLPINRIIVPATHHR